MSRRAIIAGAGVGGLAAALALLRAGFTVAIYERASTLEEFGAGLQLTPNATRVLSRLGALERVAPCASAPRAIVVRRGADDAELARMPLDDAERRWLAPYLVVHRADLQRALADAVRHEPRAELTLGATILDFADEADGVLVRLTTGSAEMRDGADLLIGADGLRSQIREGLGLGARDQAEFAGRIAYRAIVDAADPGPPPNDIILRLGRDAHLVQYPLRRGSLTNLVATISAPSPAAGDERRQDGATILERAFIGWSGAARSLIGKPPQWRAWPLYWRPPIPSFARGRVALVGDAAHPMVPFLAQGAAQAIEDAGALASTLVQTEDIPAAVSAYSRIRAARAARVQREALKLGRIYHMGGPLALARDMTMRLMGARGMAERYDWLYRA